MLPPPPRGDEQKRLTERVIFSTFKALRKWLRREPSSESIDGRVTFRYQLIASKKNSRHGPLIFPYTLRHLKLLVDRLNLLFRVKKKKINLSLGTPSDPNTRKKQIPEILSQHADLGKICFGPNKRSCLSQ